MYTDSLTQIIHWQKYFNISMSKHTKVRHRQLYTTTSRLPILLYHSSSCYITPHPVIHHSSSCFISFLILISLLMLCYTTPHPVISLIILCYITPHPVTPGLKQMFCPLPWLPLAILTVILFGTKKLARILIFFK